MSIKDKEPLFTIGMLYIFIEIIDLLGTNLIYSLAIITNSNLLSC